VSCPARAHADLVVSTLRPDPVSLLDRQDQGRAPDLVPRRWDFMAASPWEFFQGAGAVMADDLASTPTAGIPVQLSGDAHAANFGLYATPAGRLVFDLVDFDQTHPGPWEWDLKRLATSFAVAGRVKGHNAAVRRATVTRAVRRYREAMLHFAGTSGMEVWFSRADAVGLRRLHRFAAHADRRRPATGNAGSGVAELTRVDDGIRSLRRGPTGVAPVGELLDLAPQEEDEVAELLHGYRSSLVGDGALLLQQFRFVDAARTTASGSSTGVPGRLVLMSATATDEPLLLQVRRATPSVLYPLRTVPTSSDHGERVVTGQRLTAAAGDVFLGWHALDGSDGRRPYHVRELRDWLRLPDLRWMTPSMTTAYGDLCAWTLARAHARSGDRVAMAAYLGDHDAFDHALADFAEAYADQNERDYQRFLRVHRARSRTAGASSPPAAGAAARRAG